MKDDAVESVHHLEKVSVAKVKFVHVIRNPFDNLATMTLEEASVRKRDGEHKTKVCDLMDLDYKDVKCTMPEVKSSPTQSQCLWD